MRLFLCLIFLGPLGLLLWLAIREPREVDVCVNFDAASAEGGDL